MSLNSVGTTNINSILTAPWFHQIPHIYLVTTHVRRKINSPRDDRRQRCLLIMTLVVAYYNLRRDMLVSGGVRHALSIT